MFSKACEYGIKATLHIANQTQLGKRCNVKDIAQAIASPEAFTAKILQSLAKNNVITSVKGANGGYILNSQQLQNTTLLQVVTAIDGPKIYSGCGLGLTKCNAKKPCPIHQQFESVRDGLKKMLKETSIQQLSLGLADEITFLTN